MPDSALATNWWVRPRFDGGCDYVRLCSQPPQPGGSGRVEWVEGSHLPPQMPFIKKRRWLNRSEALSCRQNLERSEGFRHGKALF